MNEQIVQVPVQVVDFRPRSDRSWRLSFETRELTGDEVKILAEHYQGEGFLVFKPNAIDISPEEIPKGEAFSGAKTPSERLRNVIYVNWVERGKKGDFNSFYAGTMERIIDRFKSDLEPRK